MAGKLSVRMQRFCELLTTPGTDAFGNATEAAAQAGYCKGNRKSCAEYAAALVKKPAVKELLEKIRAKSEAKTGMTRERWVERMTAIFENEGKDRVPAGVALGKAQEFFPAEKHEVAGPDGVPISVVFNLAPAK